MYLLANIPQRITDSNGNICAGAIAYFYITGTTTPKTVFADQAGLVPLGTSVTADAGGQFPQIWLNSDTEYRIKVTKSDGTVLPGYPVDDVSGIGSGALGDLADSTDVAKGDALVAVKRTNSGAVATTLHNWIERQRLDTYADFGITPDGVTDRTAALTSLLSSLSSASFRGWLRIPYNTKFTVATVYAAVPTGVILDDESSINWGQPPSYKNKFRVMYSGDTVSDDTQNIIGSGHHPALMLLNMGTAGSTAASSRYATILHGVGKDVDGDPMLGWIQQFAKATSSKWRVSWRLQTPYSVAIANPQNWTQGAVYSANAHVVSDGGKVYKTTAGGTAGSTAPTGTGTGISDGGVTWDYVQAALNIDSTRMDLDEDGNAGFYGPTTLRVTMQGGARSHYFEINPSTSDVTWRDESRSADIWASTTTNGVRCGRIQSLNRVNTTISASGALTLLAPLHFCTASGGPWDITDLTLPAGQTSGMVTLWFAGTNMTLKNNANIVTRTGADIASAANMMVTLYKDTAISGSWVVLSKN